MAKFKYTAYNNAGVKQQGVIDAATEQEARVQLSQQNLMIAELQSQNTDNQMTLFQSQHLAVEDVEFFTSELALLLKSGLKIDRGLQILKQNVQKPALSDFLTQLLVKLKKGETLSSALENVSAFGPLYVGLVKIAEETGELQAVFDRLSAELKYQLELNSKIKQALVYPAVILTVCVLAILFIFNFVVPNLTTLFQGRDDLPSYTRGLLAVSSFMQSYQWFVIGGFFTATYLGWSQRHTATMQNLMTTLREKMPVFSAANLLVERIRFNSALATMLAAGVVIDRALRLAQNTLRTHSLQHEVKLAIEQIKRGEGLSKSLSETRLYPPYFASLLAIGEESGALGRVFEEIADRCRQQFYSWVTRFTTLLEPLLIMVMGAIVGSVVVIMMLSISAVTDMSL